MSFKYINIYLQIIILFKKNNNFNPLHAGACR